MKKPLAVISLALAASAASARVHQAARDEMIAAADVIAVVNITAVNQQPARAKISMERQRATARVERLLKGNVEPQFSFLVPSFYPCGAASVAPGRYLVFLTRGRGTLRGANWDRSYRPIQNERLPWYSDARGLTLTEQELPAVLRQVSDLVEAAAPSR